MLFVPRAAVAVEKADDDWQWGLGYSKTTQDRITTAFRRYTARLRELVVQYGPEVMAQKPPPREAVEAGAEFRREWEDAIKGVILQSGEREGDKLRFPEKFLLDNPYTVRWLRDHGSGLITEVGTETQMAVRRAVYQAVSDHRPPRELRNEVMQLVGLHSRQARALENYRRQLRDEDRSEDTIEVLTTRYANRLHRQRGLLIARTETMTGQNAGQHQAWEVARENGWVSPKSKRRWVAGMGSDRTCDFCQEMHRQEIGFDQQFTTPDGDDVDMPPLHPACRCRVVLVTAV